MVQRRTGGEAVAGSSALAKIDCWFTWKGVRILKSHSFLPCLLLKVPKVGTWASKLYQRRKVAWSDDRMFTFTSWAPPEMEQPGYTIGTREAGRGSVFCWKSLGPANHVLLSHMPAKHGSPLSWIQYSLTAVATCSWIMNTNSLRTTVGLRCPQISAHWIMGCAEQTSPIHEGPNHPKAFGLEQSAANTLVPDNTANLQRGCVKSVY